MAHISPAEAQLLHDVTDGGSINPATGLPEFFFGDFFGGLSDSFSSIGTSLSDSFSSFGDSMSNFGDSFSSGLSDFGDNFSSGLNDTFGDGFSDKFGGVAGNLTSQLAGDYVSKKVGGEFGSLLGNTVGSTLGNTVSGAFSSSETVSQPKATDGTTNTFGGLNNGMNTQKASLPKSTPKIDLNPKAGQTHVGAAQQTRNLKAINQQRDLAAKAVQTPQKAPLTLNQKIEATTKKMNATHIAEQKAKMPASQQAIYNDLVAKAKAGRQKILVQQATPQAPKPLGTASPTRSTEVLASAAPITKSPTSKPPISDERIGKEITAIKAEKPEARPSYNQLKAEATTRIEAKDAVAYSQSETPAPEPKTVEMDMDKSLETLRNGSGEDVQALVGQLKEMKDKKVKLPPELKRFHEGYTDHKAKQSDLTPPTQRIDQSDQSFAIAQRQHARQLARQETEAISAGMNAAKNNFIDALYGANLNTYVDLMAGAGALTGNPRSAGFIKAMKGIADKNVAKNYGKTTSAVMGRMFGGGADRGVQAYPGTGFIHAAGTTATKVGESGASMKEVTRQARGAAGANLLGGKLPAGSAVLFRAIKAPKAKSLLDYTLKGGEKALGYAAEKGLKGTMGGVEKGKSPSKPKIRK